MMDIRAALLEAHSKAQTEKIVHFVGKDKSRFAALVALFLHDTGRVVQRAAWPLSDISIAHPELTQDYLHLFLERLRHPGMHVAVKRHVMRIFQVVALPVALHAELMNIAFDYVCDRGEAVAVRACAITVLGRLVLIYPEMVQELQVVLEDLITYEQSAGLLNRAGKELARIRRAI